MLVQPYTLWVKVIPVHLYSKVCVCVGGGGGIMLRDVTLFKKRKMLRQPKEVERRVAH